MKNKKVAEVINMMQENEKEEKAMLQVTKKGSVGELKGLLAAARKSDAQVAIVDIPRYLLTIDTRYQTDIRTKRSLNYLVRNFDRRKMMPLLVVPHDEEGLAYIVDGYGRYMATEEVDPQAYATLPCMVVLNAPTAPVERLCFEAEQYAYQNRDVAKMKPVQKHGAFECLKYTPALMLDEMQKEYGFEMYSSQRGQKKEGVLGSYNEAYNICKVYGEDCFRYIMDVCERSRFNTKANGYARYILKMLRDIWKLYADDREKTKAYLGDFLRTLDPQTLKANAVAKYPILNAETAVSLYAEDKCVENLGLDHMRVVNGKAIVLAA